MSFLIAHNLLPRVGSALSLPSPPPDPLPGPSCQRNRKIAEPAPMSSMLYTRCETVVKEQVQFLKVPFRRWPACVPPGQSLQKAEHLRIHRD